MYATKHLVGTSVDLLNFISMFKEYCCLITHGNTSGSVVSFQMVAYEVLENTRTSYCSPLPAPQGAIAKAIFGGTRQSATS